MAGPNCEPQTLAFRRQTTSSNTESNQVEAGGLRWRPFKEILCLFSPGESVVCNFCFEQSSRQPDRL